MTTLKVYIDLQRISRIVKLAIAGVLAITSFCANSFAQGSPYDLIGFGDAIITQSARLDGLAGAAVASTESRTINDVNPAAFSFLTRARIEAQLGFSYNKSTLGSDEGVQRVVKFAGVSFATPLWGKHVGFALGFAPLTNADAQSTQADTTGTKLYKREGGLSQFYLGLSARPISSLNIGARADFLFGNIRTISQADASHGEQAVPGVFQREYAMSGIRGTFGFLLTLDSLVPDLRGLTIGGAFSTGASLKSMKRTIVTPINSSLDSTIEEAGFGSYPSQIRLGIATRFGDRYRVEADIIGQDFSNASIFDSLNAVTADPNLGSSNRYSLGIERLPIMGEESKGYSFWERAGLRLGASYAILPFRPDTKSTVNEKAITAGVGLPLNVETLLDFSVSLGIRTPQVSSAPSDFFFKMRASISLSEKWFVPLRRDDDD